MVLFMLVTLPFPLLLLYFIVRPRPVKVPIKDRHVFITGGSSGIGLAIAKRAASEGARVSIMARNLEKLEEARQSIRLASGALDVSIFSADARDGNAVQRAVNDAGPIDVLVVNHGLYEHDKLKKQGLDVVNCILDVNLIWSFNVIKAALPLMTDRKDRGPASIALGVTGRPGIYSYTAYSASNFGLRGLAEALQQEVIEDNIHVSLMFPPDTETPNLEKAKRTMPELTKIIIGSPVPMKADEVGKKTLDGIKSGSFIIPCNLIGYLLAFATAGVSPQRSFLMAFPEVALAGISRLVVLFYLWNWYRTIRKWHAQTKRA